MQDSVVGCKRTSGLVPARRGETFEFVKGGGREVTIAMELEVGGFFSLAEADPGNLKNLLEAQA